jgi:hypothetical protein
MRISDHSASRPIAREERRYLESVLRAENASVTVAATLYASIGLALVVLLARALATLKNLLVWRRLAKS